MTPNEVGSPPNADGRSLLSVAEARPLDVTTGRLSSISDSSAPTSESRNMSRRIPAAGGSESRKTKATPMTAATSTLKGLTTPLSTPSEPENSEPPASDEGSRRRSGRPLWQQTVTSLILFGPFVGVVVAAASLFGHGVTALDLVLAGVFYVVTGHGLTAGYHRLFSHRSFKAARWLKISLAIAGSLAFEGSPIGWAANHRRHHAYTDREGDPHSPYAYGQVPWSRIRGAIHAHVGWLLRDQPSDNDRWVRDLLADADLVVISRLFPLFCLVSLSLPALVGWLVSGSLAGALGGLVWGGLVRVFLLHQATFAVNSAGHMWGKRPYETREWDRSTNFAPLALLSLGDNWHNNHHSNPRLARHGVDRYQLDSTARLIFLLERIGAASAVHHPDPVALASRRRPGPAEIRTSPPSVPGAIRSTERRRSEPAESADQLADVAPFLE